MKFFLRLKDPQIKNHRRRIGSLSTIIHKIRSLKIILKKSRPNHHFKLTLHKIREILAQSFISSSKDNIINIYMYYNEVLANFSSEKSYIYFFPFIKPFSKRKQLILSYQARGACFRPYMAFWSLKTWSRSVWSSKLGGCLTYASSSIKPLKKAFMESIWKNFMFLWAAEESMILITSSLETGARVSVKSIPS